MDAINGPRAQLSRRNAPKFGKGKPWPARIMRRCGVATEQKPASLHSSPQDAMQSAPEEFLYLACLHDCTTEIFR